MTEEEYVDYILDRITDTLTSLPSDILTYHRFNHLIYNAMLNYVLIVAAVSGVTADQAAADVQRVAALRAAKVNPEVLN